LPELGRHLVNPSLHCDSGCKWHSGTVALSEASIEPPLIISQYAVLLEPLSYGKLLLPSSKYTRTKFFALRFMRAIRQMEPPDRGYEDAQALDSLGDRSYDILAIDIIVVSLTS
jgi:hypothetical protein